MSEALWHGEDFFHAVGGNVYGILPKSITGISIDSRTLQEGEAFFAIRGEQFDGHDFAAAALKAGASVLVVAASQESAMQQLKAPLLVVPDVLQSLENLGRAARARSGAKIIAITGSVGKTTTKEILRYILSNAYFVHANPASFNNHWGVPLTLARLPKEADFAIFEIGMNHQGEITPLVQMVRPHLALITCVANAHSEYFASLTEIAAAKAEIFAGLEPGATALINRDDCQFDFLHQAALAAGAQHIVSFGRHEKADYRLTKITTNETSSDCHFCLHGIPIRAKIGVAGQHMALNMLSGLAVANILQLDIKPIVPSLAHFTPPAGRGARHIVSLDNEQSFILLDESYNANPTSMRSALQVLGATTPKENGRRIAILGDMLELGQQSHQTHIDLLQPILQAKIDILFLIGSEMHALALGLEQFHKSKGYFSDKNCGKNKNLEQSAKLSEVKTALEHLASTSREAKITPAVTWRQNWQDLLPIVIADLRSNDVISIKSSKATGTSHIVSALLQQSQSKAV